MNVPAPLALARFIAGFWASGLAEEMLAADAPAARIDWAADLDFFARELPARHKNLFFLQDRAQFEGTIHELKAELPQASDVEVALRLQEITAALGDDHTGVTAMQLMPKGEALVLGLYWFSDGWRVTSIAKPHESLLGRRLVAIGSVPMAEVEARVGRLVSPANPWLVKSRLTQWLAWPAVLRHFQLATDSVTLTTEADDGVKTETLVSLSGENLRGQEAARLRPKAIADAVANQRMILRHALLATDRIFYVQYNRCEGRETAERRGDREAAARLPSLEALFGAALSDLKTAVAKNRVDAFVFDVRFNPGGASDFGTRFARQVAELRPLNGNGRSFVIVGRQTFSSAMINALDFKRFTGARMVGEPTGGTPNHYGEVKAFVLPSSKLTVNYSTKYFGTAGQPIVPLAPDIVAEMSFAEFDHGRDASMEAIKAAMTAAGRR